MIHSLPLILSKTLRWFIWVNNIKIDLQEFRLGNMDWIGMARDRDRWQVFTGAVMNLRVP